MSLLPLDSSNQELEKAFRKYLKQARFCYKVSLKTEPMLEEKITFSVTTNEGKIVAVTSTVNQTKNKDLVEFRSYPINK